MTYSLCIFWIHAALDVSVAAVLNIQFDVARMIF